MASVYQTQAREVGGRRKPARRWALHQPPDAGFGGGVATPGKALREKDPSKCRIPQMFCPHPPHPVPWQGSFWGCRPPQGARP